MARRVRANGRRKEARGGSLTVAAPGIAHPQGIMVAGRKGLRDVEGNAGRDRARARVHARVRDQDRDQHDRDHVRGGIGTRATTRIRRSASSAGRRIRCGSGSKALQAANRETCIWRDGEGGQRGQWAGKRGDGPGRDFKRGPGGAAGSGTRPRTGPGAGPRTGFGTRQGFDAPGFSAGARPGPAAGARPGPRPGPRPGSRAKPGHTTSAGLRSRNGPWCRIGPYNADGSAARV